MNKERKITIIEPVRQKIEITATEIPEKLRVAAYARVSTEQDEQQSSYEAQVDFYTRYIQGNPNWEFVAVFADEGITGTNTRKRDGFNLMIQKAMNGEIDLILTKSISRFARNTVDTLQTVRKLKAIGVEVIFEKENLHTLDPKSEVMLTIMSSLAQEESRSISENVRWGKQKSMRDGKVSLAYSRFLGYKKGPDGRPEIVEEEAVIVRDIYNYFLSGKTLNEIAALLTRMGIPTPAGKSKWCVSTVRSILSNEKYKGEALLQKTYTVDYLTKEVRKNNGEVASILVRHSHEAIIEPEVFDLVQEMLAENIKRRSKVRSNSIWCRRCWQKTSSADLKYAASIRLPVRSSAAIVAVSMVTRFGDCAVQVNTTMSGTVTTSMMAMRHAALRGFGRPKSGRHLKKCCKNAVIRILSTPMSGGMSWFNPLQFAGIITFSST